MPQNGMDWWQIIAALAAVAAVVVAFMRRPKKTTNTVIRGDGNTLKGSEGTTKNLVRDGSENTLEG